MTIPTPKRIIAGLATATVAVTSLSACTLFSSGDDGKIQFLSLAWQEDSKQANKDIVAEWNEKHPDSQIEYVQGDWESVHDELQASFESGDAPDIIHYEASASSAFVDQGYLADISGDIPSDLKGQISDDVWDTVTGSDGQITGVPFLLESFGVVANKTMLEKAGIKIPDADDPWTWDEFAANAKKLTKGDVYGTAWPLQQPAYRMMNYALNYDGEFFSTKDGKTEVRFGAGEKEVPQRIHDMLYKDESADPSALSMNADDPLPSFFEGKFALLPEAVYLRQQLADQAPEDFEWAFLPPLKGQSQNQAGNPQTLSIAEQSPHKETAMEFINEFNKPKNMARLAMGDWMIPTGKDAGQEVLKATGGQDGWDVAIASQDSLVNAPFQNVPEFTEWESKYATPAFQDYFAGNISIKELGDKLEDGNKVLN